MNPTWNVLIKRMSSKAQVKQTQHHVHDSQHERVLQSHVSHIRYPLHDIVFSDERRRLAERDRLLNDIARS